VGLGISKGVASSDTLQSSLLLGFNVVQGKITLKHGALPIGFEMTMRLFAKNVTKLLRSTSCSKLL